jgi:hypothetical protein
MWLELSRAHQDRAVTGHRAGHKPRRNRPGQRWVHYDAFTMAVDLLGTSGLACPRIGHMVTQLRSDLSLKKNCLTSVQFARWQVLDLARRPTAPATFARAVGLELGLSRRSTGSRRAASQCCLEAQR